MPATEGLASATWCPAAWRSTSGPARGETRFGEHLWLDIPHAARRGHIVAACVAERICQHFLVIDPSRDLIPVRQLTHYSMGGIRTTMPRAASFYVVVHFCGEAACWDLHGFSAWAAAQWRGGGGQR